MAVKKLKQKKCRDCGEYFNPWTSTQTACSPLCALAIVNDRKAKQERRQQKISKLKLKSKAEWLKEAQTAVNAFIRIRDAGKPCISCDKPDSTSHQRHASHYRSVGACSSLRFNTFNIYASCATCNSVLSGNLIEYRIRLKNKIGHERVDWLESQNGIVRYDIDYAKRVKRIFRKRAAIYRKIRSNKGIH